MVTSFLGWQEYDYEWVNSAEMPLSEASNPQLVCVCVWVYNALKGLNEEPNFPLWINKVN